MSKPKDKKEKIKRQAIEMLASGLNQNETSKKLNVTRQTISNWMKNDDFRNKVQKLKNESSNDEQILPEKIVFIPQPVDGKLHYQVQSREYYFKKEIELLNKIENSILPLLKENSIRAATVLLKLSERRSKLLALNINPMPEYEAVLRLVESDLLPVEVTKQILPIFEDCKIGLKDVFNSKYQVN